MKRDVAAILAAHKLDPARRELYVEGHRDRMVLLWLAGAELHKNSKVIEIRFVNVNVDADGGGDRGRVLKFATQVQNESAQIRCLVDADFDRLFGITPPANVWFTDLRDLEGYALREDCIDKIFRLHANTDQVVAWDLLAQLRGAARQLSALRLTSDRLRLKLPFQKTAMDRQVAATKTGFTFDVESYLRTLLQRAGISLSEFGAIYKQYMTVAEEFSSAPDSEMVHGKDAVRLLSEVLLTHGIARDECEGVLFLSLEREMLTHHVVLGAAIRYLTVA